MRGFLERLASSVLHPGGTIHPVLAPVFSAQAYPAAPEPFAEERVASPTRASQPALDKGSTWFASSAENPEFRGAMVRDSAKQSIAGPAHIIAKPEEANATPEEQNAGVQPAMERGTRKGLTSTYEAGVRRNLDGSEALASEPQHGEDYAARTTASSVPIKENMAGNDAPLPIPQFQRAGREARPIEDSLSRSGARDHLFQPGDKQPQPHPADRVMAAVSRGPLVPLVEKEPHSIREEEIFRGGREKTAQPPNIAVPNFRNEQAGRFPGRPKQHDSNADEIQIHIGRIEVTAALPVQPRPATTPTRKQHTLEDYLKRGHGRT